MRSSIILLCLLSFTAYGQVIQPGQTRQVLSSAASAENIGSPLITSAVTPLTVTGWTIVSETNPVIAGVGLNEVFFSITTAGQLQVFQGLTRFFPVPETPPVIATLALQAFFSDGSVSVAETVAVTIAYNAGNSSAPPIIPANLHRGVAVQADVGASVSAALVAFNGADTWSITAENNYFEQVVPGVDQTETFFEIDNSGQIKVLVSLERFFNVFALTRGDTITVQLTVQADSAFGTDIEDVFIDISEGTTAAVLGSQGRVITSDTAPETAVGDVLLAVGDPTYWAIVGGSILDDGGAGFSADGAFAIDNAGQITNTIYLDQFFYNANPFGATLTVVCGNQFGESSPTIVPIDIIVLVGRCGSIPPTQTRYVSSNAVAGDPIGLLIDHHGLDSIWIQEAWINGNIDVASYFTIDAVGSTTGQLRAARALSSFFDIEAITAVDVYVRGHSAAAQCGEFIDQEITVYVLPADGSTPTDPGGGTTAPDLSAYIEDAELLACIRERVGLATGDPLSPELVLSLAQLDCACRNGAAITNLNGIHLFTGLVDLNLANNLISDIRPVAPLTLLTTLRLAGNMISDITTSNPLAAMVAMSTIDLSYNQIRDTNAFSTMTELSFISLANNQVCDVTSLVALANTGAITNTDTIKLDNNHLLTSGGQAQIATLQNTGANVSVFGNDGVCPPAVAPVNLSGWPEVSDVRPILSIINENLLNVACPL